MILNGNYLKRCDCYITPNTVKSMWHDLVILIRTPLDLVVIVYTKHRVYSKPDLLTNYMYIYILTYQLVLITFPLLIIFSMHPAHQEERVHVKKDMSEDLPICDRSTHELLPLTLTFLS